MKLCRKTKQSLKSAVLSDNSLGNLRSKSSFSTLIGNPMRVKKEDLEWKTGFMYELRHGNYSFGNHFTKCVMCEGNWTFTRSNLIHR